jgi:cell division septation protein DedD
MSFVMFAILATAAPLSKLPATSLRRYSDLVGFLILCAAIVLILIAMRINAWSKSQPDRRYIVVNTPEGHRRVVERPATATGGASTQARPQPQAQPLAQPEDEPLAQSQPPPPDQPVTTTPVTTTPVSTTPVSTTPVSATPEPPMQTDAPGGSDAESASDPPEPPTPLEMLSPKIVAVPPPLAAQVVTLMNSRQEVSAVRLLCDELRIGILDAQRTARSLVGR